MCLVSFESWELILQFVSSGLTKLDETIGYCGAQLLWGGRYSCNNVRYVMSYIEINKAVSQWLLTFNLCVSVTWPLTCAFHIPCTHTHEIIDMHRGVCDNTTELRRYHSAVVCSPMPVVSIAGNYTSIIHYRKINIYNDITSQGVRGIAYHSFQN